MDTTGGDVDVKSILDVDYFDNKYFGSLKVPKQFLGQSEDMPGGLGDTTLTRLDIRYARTVKRGQKSAKSGVEDIIIWKCVIDNEVPPPFTVEMAKVTSADEDEKAAGLDSALDRVERINAMIEELVEGDYDKVALLEYCLDKVSGDPTLKDLIRLKKDEGEEDGESGGDSLPEDVPGGGAGGSSDGEDNQETFGLGGNGEDDEKRRPFWRLF